VAKHLIKQVTLWKLEHWSLLLISNLPVHNVDNFVLVLQKGLHLLDFVDLQGNTLRKVVESLQQDLFILSESLDISVQSLNVSIKVSNLRLLKLNLFIKVNLLLSDDVQFSDLIVDDLLSLLQSIVDLVNLVFDLLDLLLSIFDHLITVLNLSVQVVGKLLSLGLLEVLQQQSLSLKHKLCLLLTYCGHRGKKILDLLDILFCLIPVRTDICDINLELSRPFSMAVVQFCLHLRSLPLHILQLPLQLLNLLIVLQLLDIRIRILQLLQLSILESEIILLPQQLLALLLGLYFDLVCALSLLLDLLVKGRRHESHLFSEHVDPLFCLG
jgi:hypothetical protein